MKQKTIAEVREQRQLTLDYVAEKIGITKEQIQALEKGDFSVFSDDDSVDEAIIIYTSFLKVSPEPLRQDFKGWLVNHRSRRSAHLAGRSVKKKPFQLKWFHVVAIVSIPILIFFIWFLFGQPEQAVKEMNEGEEAVEVSTIGHVNTGQQRPVVTLDAASEEEEIWLVKGVNKLEVELTGLQSSTVTIQEGNEATQPVALASGETKKKVHTQQIVLTLPNPNQVELKINGVTIQTKEQTEEQVYRMKIEATDEE